jgi:preprotein translocase SecE subunit
MTRLVNYLRDTVAEMKHVSWPTQSQAIIYTLLVIAISVVVALLLSGFDYVFTNLLDMIV